MSRWKRMIAGDRYGDLVILESEPEMRNGQPFFKCRCKCGKIVYVRGPNLRSHRTESCGCSRKKPQIKPMWKRRGVKIWGGGGGRIRVRDEEEKVMPVPAPVDKKLWLGQCLTCLKFDWYTKREVLDGHAPLCECLQPTHISYTNALDRCYVDSDKNGYPAVGGRGVRMTKRWTRGYKGQLKVTQEHGFYVMVREIGVRPFECQPIRNEQGRRIIYRKAEHTAECKGPQCKLRTLDRVDPNGHYVESNTQWSTAAEQLQHKRKERTGEPVAPLVE